MLSLSLLGVRARSGTAEAPARAKVIDPPARAGAAGRRRSEKSDGSGLVVRLLGRLLGLLLLVLVLVVLVVLVVVELLNVLLL